MRTSQKVRISRHYKIVHPEKITNTTNMRRFIRENDYMYNLINPDDPIIVRNDNFTKTLHLPCPSCGGLFSKIGLYNHNKKCGNILNVKTVANEMNFQGLCSHELKEIVDRIVGVRKKVIFQDNLLLAVGERLVKKFGNIYGDHCRQILRTMASFLLEYKELYSEAETYESLFPRDLTTVMFLKSSISLASINSL